MIRYARGSSKYDAHPEIREAVDFDAFEQAVITDRALAKGQQYIAAPFRINGDGRTHRGKEGVEPRRFLALDVDHIAGPETYTELRLWLARFKGFGFTTASSTPNAPRCRVIIELDRDADRAEGIRVGAAIERDLRVEFGDTVTLDDSTHRGEQPCYCPVKQSEAFRLDGEALNVDASLSSAPKLRPEHKGAGSIEPTEDPVIAALKERGMYRRALDAGRHAIRCPWESEHTEEDTETSTATAYMQPYHQGYVSPGFACKHRHCASRKGDELLRYLGLDWRTVADAYRSRVKTAHSVTGTPACASDPSSAESATYQPAQPKTGSARSVLIPDIKAPLAVARAFVDKHFRVRELPTLHYWQGQPYRWNGSAYTATDPSAIRQRLYSYLEAGCNEAGGSINPNRRIVDDIQDALRAVTHLEPVQTPTWLREQPPHPLSELIPCANGIVHVPTRALAPATPALFNLNATAFDFDPTAPDPSAWREFLASIFDDDCDAIEALQEFFGLALTLETKYQKALLIVGPKRSGKGTIARVLTALVGPTNTAAPTLAGLGGPFGLQAFIGKQLAIISDARLGGRADIHAITENLLRITGEDHIGVPRKHLADFTARLPVRFVIMTNEVPALADSSGALPSRFIVLRLTRTFYGREDTDLTNKLLSELSGVFLWALEGLERLRKRGAFVQPASGQAMLDQLDELASPIKAFLRERCALGSGASIDCGYLFSKWQEWCRESNREHPGTVQTFGRNLAAAVPGIEARQQRVNGERVRHYMGVRLRSAGDPE